jgi:WD40 repeat protein
MIGARLLQFFDVHSGQIIRSIPAHPSAILDIQMDEDFVYTCSIDRTVAIWNRTTGARESILYGHLKAVYQIQLYDNMLISAGKDKTIRFWDPRIKDDLNAPPFPAHVEEPASVTYGVDKDGVTLKPAAGVNIKAGSKALKAVILAHDHSVRRFGAYDGSLVSVCGQNQGAYWDLETRTLVRQFEVMDDALTLALRENDVVIAGPDKVQHFDLRTPCIKPSRVCEDYGGRHLHLDSSKMLLSDSKGSIRVMDWNLFREVICHRVAKHRCCYFYDTQTERLYTGGSDKFVKLFDFSLRPNLTEIAPSEKKCLLM